MKSFVLVVTLLLASISGAAAQDPLKSLPSRMEIIPFESLTISDNDFLKGDKSRGKPVSLGGLLHIAQGQGKLPTVILLHGSGGLGPAQEQWVREFAEAGISTFVIDAFTGRGIVSTSGDQGQLGRLNMILDVYRSMEKLAVHPRVDQSRLALIGFSRGGQGTLYAALERFHRMWNASGLDFSAYIPFYPDCMTTFIGDTNTGRAPIRFHHGEIDDYNPLAQCRAFAERLKAAGRDVEITVYPNAAHAFDNPFASAKPVVSSSSMTVRNCVLKEEPEGQITNARTGQLFAYNDPCVERGPSLGGNAVAGPMARKNVREFLKTLFKL